ncbi:hypothetical protein DRO32_01480, partial [Candidatus Bathyarchaeota archaeon]
VLAGRILALAAFHDGRWATCIQAYSSRVRGAPVESDVIISDRRISYPFVRRPDILVALAEPAFRFASRMAEDGILITDTSLAHLAGGLRARKVLAPIFEAAGEAGSPSLANMVALGVLVGHTELVSARSVEEAVGESVSAAFLEQDLRAFRLGLRL